MNYNDVMLWFAKDKNGNIITINEVNKQENHTYYCPLCGSEVIPRQGEIQSWCFAHIDKSKCTSESMYHFWIKNKLLEKGDKFIIKSDIEREYVCKDILVEKSYNVDGKIYRPDLTVLTECGKNIYFEMDYTNTKKIEDYIDIWIGLENIVVEVDVKTLVNSRSGNIPLFKAKYYDGKCFNIKKGKDTIYHETIGKYKEKAMKNNQYEKRKNEIEKLDWLWRDIQKYKTNKVDIEYMSKLIQSIEDKECKNIVVSVLRRSSCNQILKDYVKYNSEFAETIFKSFNIDKIDKIKYEIKVPHKIYDRLFDFKVNFSYKDSCLICKNIDFLNEKTLNHVILGIEEEIKEEKKIAEEIKKIKKYINFKNDKNNYNKLCNNIRLTKEPYIEISKSYFPSRVYGVKYSRELCLKNILNSNYDKIIEITNCNDISKIYTLIDRTFSYDTYNYFSKEDIEYIDRIAKKICDVFNYNDFEIDFKIYNRKTIEIDAIYKGYEINTIMIDKDKYFYAKKLYVYLYILIKKEINKIIKHIDKVKVIKNIISRINEKFKINKSTSCYHISLDVNSYHWNTSSGVKLRLNNYFYDLNRKTKNIIDQYFDERIKSTHKYMKKKIESIITHEVMEYAYDKIRKKKYNVNLKDIRNYKISIIKNLRKNNFDILSIKPMCNKPYIKVIYQNGLSHNIFLSQHDYDNCNIHDKKYDILTILKENSYKHFKYCDFFDDYMIVNKNGVYSCSHKSEMLRIIIKNELKNLDYNKKINLFYYKSRPKNKRYKNLNDFNFVQAINTLKFVRDKFYDDLFDEFDEIMQNLVFNLPYFLSDVDLVSFKHQILNQKYIKNLFNLFFNTINIIKSDEINILLNIKYTISYGEGYKPWIINDFIYELRQLGFHNVINIKSEKEDD